MKVLAINGSPRKNGNTAQLIDEVFKVLQTYDVETEQVQVGGELIRGCNACYVCKKKADKKCHNDEDLINPLIEKMIEADGIIMASPTYFSNVSAELKAVIDRTGVVNRANGFMFQRKAGAAIVAARRAGQVAAFDAINHYFLACQMIVPGANYWNMGLGKDKGDVQNDTEGLENMQNLGENMAWLLKRIAE